MRTAEMVLAALGWIAGWLMFCDVHPLPRGASTTAPISVIVPCRDEQQRLPRLLTRLAGDQDVGELIVVDDGSSDATASIARAAGAQVVASEPPPGWTGKCAACAAGAATATGTILVFLDADCEPHPDFVGRLAGAAQRTSGLVSVQPWHRVERWYEHLSAVCNTIAVGATGTGAPTRLRIWRRAGAFGPAMAIPADVYWSVGGHGSVRASVTEDIALARVLDRAGRAVRCYAGRGVDFRMYPEGGDALVAGWTKNIAAGARSAAPLRVALVVMWITGAIAATVALARWGWSGAAAYTAFVAQAAVLFRRVGSFRLHTAALFPLAIAAFVVLFGLSVGRRLLGRPPRWRGRGLPAPER